MERQILRNLIEEPKWLDTINLYEELFTGEKISIFNKIHELYLQGKKITAESIKRLSSPAFKKEVIEIMKLPPTINTEELCDHLREEVYRDESAFILQKSYADVVEGKPLEETIMEVTNKLGQIIGSNFSKIANKDIECHIKEWLNQEDPEPILTNIESLDSFLFIQPSDYIIVGGRPSQGKTLLTLNFILNMVLSGKNCIFFSVEMKSSKVMNRIIANGTGIRSELIKKRLFTDAELNRVKSFLKKLKASQLKIVDNMSYIEDIISECRRQNQKKPVDLIVVDHLALLGSKRKFSSANEEMEFISRQIKLISNETNAASIAVSQLSRRVEERECKVPLLSDLRQSGAIEQDADVVMFPFRPHYYDRSSDETLMQIYVAKNRDGEVGCVDLKVDLTTQTISDKF